MKTLLYLSLLPQSICESLLNMIPYQWVNYEAFVIAFLLGALAHNWTSGIMAVMSILFFVFWASDFFLVTPTVAIFEHIWVLGVAWSAGLCGHIYAKSMQAPQLIFFSNLRSLRENVYIPLTDILVFLFNASAILVAVGINFWLGRTILGGGGLSPIGTDLITPGIAMTIIGAILLVIVTVAATQIEFDGRVSIKYLWFLVVPPISLIFCDLGFYQWGWADGIPQVVALAIMLALYILGWLYVVYVPVVRHKELDEEDRGRFKPEIFDPLYRNMYYSLAYVGGIVIILVIAWVLLNAIASWTNKSLETGAITMICTGGGVAIISAIIGWAAYDYIKRLKNVVIEEVTTQAPVRLDELGNMRTSNGSYQSLRSPQPSLQSLVAQMNSTV